jgi:hypothetical protein
MRIRISTVVLAALVTACGDDDSNDDDDGGNGDDVTSREFVYLESNAPDGNEIIAFERGSDGALTFSGRTAAGGTGITAGANQRLGPLDSDQQLVVTEDARRLYAVNSGDRTIAGFDIASDGTLAMHATSPFESGGPNPVSLGLDGDTLYVVNKAADGTVPPSYAAIDLTGDGPRLIGTTTGRPGGSPTIAYLSRDGRFVFGTEFLDGARPMAAPVDQIEVFVRAPDGSLELASGSPVALPPDDTGIAPQPPQVALNLIEHPDRGILYVGFPTRSQVGVYTFDDAGTLDFVATAANSGKAVCWFLIDDEARFMYTVNSADASISTYDLADPLAPLEIAKLTLKDAVAGPPYVDAMGVEQTITSMPFELAFDLDRSHIYVVSQRVTTNADDPAGNFLHILDVTDGGVAEPNATIDLAIAGVPATARPQGVVVVAPGA